MCNVQQTNHPRGKIPLFPETPTNPDPLLMGLRVFFRSCKLVPVSGTFPPPEKATWHWLIHAVWALWKMSHMAYIDLVVQEIVTVMDNIWLHVASVLVWTVQSLHVCTVTIFVIILTEITPPNFSFPSSLSTSMTASVELGSFQKYSSIWIVEQWSTTLSQYHFS